MVPISINVGANRIVPGQAIPYPVGNPELDLENEKEFRRLIVETALKAICTDISQQTIFEIE